MRNFLIYADIDGVLTPCQKLFHCVNQKQTVFPFDENIESAPDFPELRWFKTFSDRDSYVMRLMKDDLVFISHDRRNRYFVDYKSHKFCFVDHADGDKFNGLKRDWAERVQNREVEGDPDKPRYFYIGDAPFDWLCLKHSIIGFMPQDASQMLKLKAKKTRELSDLLVRHMPNGEPVCVLGRYTLLNSNGGAGCIEEMMYYIYRGADLIKSEYGVDISNMEVIKVIREFLE